ncbi:hypothetical protein V1478_016965 [Vespula squamosa]|uniref:Uncharacterized protein n=1 Tax=Vespula squamosa TaxID=30214 RepID=A0ABD1ZY04_VESSQ
MAKRLRATTSDDLARKSKHRSVGRPRRSLQIFCEIGMILMRLSQLQFAVPTSENLLARPFSCPLSYVGLNALLRVFGLAPLETYNIVYIKKTSQRMKSNASSSVSVTWEKESGQYWSNGVSSLLSVTNCSFNFAEHFRLDGVSEMDKKEKEEAKLARFRKKCVTCRRSSEVDDVSIRQKYIRFRFSFRESVVGSRMSRGGTKWKLLSKTGETGGSECRCTQCRRVPCVPSELTGHIFSSSMCATLDDDVGPNTAPEEPPKLHRSLHGCGPWDHGTHERCTSSDGPDAPSVKIWKYSFDRFDTYRLIYHIDFNNVKDTHEYIFKFNIYLATINYSFDTYRLIYHIDFNNISEIEIDQIDSIVSLVIHALYTTQYDRLTLQINTIQHYNTLHDTQGNSRRDGTLLFIFEVLLCYQKRTTFDTCRGAGQRNSIVMEDVWLISPNLTFVQSGQKVSRLDKTIKRLIARENFRGDLLQNVRLGRKQD